MSTTRTWLAALLVVLAAAPGVVAAQQAGTATTAKPKQLTQQQQLTAANAVLDAGTKLSERLTSLEKAAKDKVPPDIVIADCYKARATKLTSVVDAVSSHLERLKSATTADERNHEMEMLGTLASQIKGIAKEADMCVGDSVYETGSTTVISEINTALIPWVRAVGFPPASFLDQTGNSQKTPDLTSIPPKTKPASPKT